MTLDELNKMLYPYDSITMTLKSYKNICDINKFFEKEANESFNILRCNMFSSDISQNASVIVSKRGAFLDLSGYINSLLNKNNIDIFYKDRAIKEIKERIKKIQSGELKRKDVYQYKSVHKILEFYKNITNKKQKEKLVFKHYIKQLQYLLKLIENQERYSSLSISMINKDKLQDKIIYTIINNYKSLKEESKEKAINYLKEHKNKEVEQFLSLHEKEEKKDKTPQKQKDKYNITFFKQVEDKDKMIEYFRCKGIKSKNEENLKELLNRKLELYKSLNIIEIKLGIDSYDGYIGICLENGYVILDKLFTNRNEGKIASENAIYIVGKENFEKIIRMTKQEAIENINNGNIKGKRIIHNDTFEERVKKYVQIQK